MNGKQLRRERERLGVSRTELALAADVRREDVAGWERTSASIPRPARERIVASLAAAHRARVLEGSGLAECPWAAERGAAVEGSAEVRAHVAACDLCRARERYVRDRSYFPLPLSPFGGKLFEMLGTASGPSLALMGAGVVVILLGLARLLRHLPFLEPLVLLVYPFALVLAGVVGLVLYASLSPLHRGGAVGRWMARCVAGAAAMVGFLSMFIISGYGATLNRGGDPITWREGVTVGLVMGFMYATMYPLAKALRGAGGRH